jgi:O-antigen ligase
VGWSSNEVDVMANGSATLDGNDSLPVASGSMAAMVLFGVMASLPFLVPYHQDPIPSFQSEWLAMLLGLLGALVLLATNNGMPLRMPSIVVAPLALTAVIAAQLAAGMFAYAASAVTVSMYLLWSMLLACSGSMLAQAAGERRITSWLAWFVLAGGLANAIAGLLQYLQLSHAFGELIAEPMALSVHGIYGNLAQQNHFSTHIALAIASAVYLRLSRQFAIRWFILSGVILLAALALSGSRSGILHLAWIAALWMWLLRKNADSSRYRRAAPWIAGIGVVIAFVLFAAHRYLPAIPQLDRLFAMSSAFGPRVYLWKHALQMFQEHPLLGVGFDAFAYRLVGQLHEAGVPTAWGVDQYAHNLGLQLLAVSGLCGFMAVAIPGALFLRRQFTQIVTAERMWIWGMLGVLLIHSMLEQPLYYAYFLGLAALAAGMADTSTWALPAGTKSKTLMSTLLVSGVVFLIKTAGDYDKLDGYFYSGRYFNGADAAQFEARSKVVLELRARSILAPLSELVSPGDFVPANAPAEEKIALNMRVMHYAPTAEVEFRHAALLADGGRFQEANAQFDRAALAYPNDAAQYLERFNMLAGADATTYGKLAAHANESVNKRRANPQGNE